MTLLRLVKRVTEGTSFRWTFCKERVGDLQGGGWFCPLKAFLLRVPVTSQGGHRHHPRGRRQHAVDAPSELGGATNHSMMAWMGRPRGLLSLLTIILLCPSLGGLCQGSRAKCECILCCTFPAWAHAIRRSSLRTGLGDPPARSPMRASCASCPRDPPQLEDHRGPNSPVRRTLGALQPGPPCLRTGLEPPPGPPMRASCASGPTTQTSLAASLIRPAPPETDQASHSHPASMRHHLQRPHTCASGHWAGGLPCPPWRQPRGKSMFFRSTPIQMPPESGGICGRLT